MLSVWTWLLLLFTIDPWVAASFAQTANHSKTATVGIGLQKNEKKDRRLRPSPPIKKRSAVRPKNRVKQRAKVGDLSSSLVIKGIQIEGNSQIEKDAILAKLVSKVGDALDPKIVRKDIDSIFGLGYFYDIQVSYLKVAGGIDLVYSVVEKPSIAEVVFLGNSEINGDELKTTAGIKTFEILNMAKVKEAQEKLQKQYEDKGFFLARIAHRIETMQAPAVGDGDVQPGDGKPKAGDRPLVRLIFDIQENEKVKVKRISLLGAKQVPASKIKSAMATQEGGFFSFVSSSGSFKQEAFDRDLQLINYLYFNEGYVQVKVDRPQVYVTPDKKGIYITIRIDEGDRFRVGKVDFSGDLLFTRAELEESVEIDSSTWYTHETLLKDIRTVQAKYGDLGYAYANIIPRTRIREQDKEVDLTFEVDKGNKVYFGKINVTGNTRTRDKVVRRELMIFEGELYNETMKRESLDNIKRLGFFDEVNFNSSTPPDNQDLMNIDIVVKERNTGSIQVGAGYSTFSQFIFNGQVNQINLFGRGQRLGLSIDIAFNQSLYNLSFTEPFFLDSLWTTGFDAYQSIRTTTEFQELKRGGAVRVGYPITRFFRTFIRYKFEDTQISVDPTFGDPALFPVPTPENPNPEGNPNGVVSSATVTLELDQRNDRFNPTAGIYTSGSLEYAGLGGDQSFTKGTATFRWYQPLFWSVVFRNNLTYGVVRANRPGDAPPFNELFLLGGANHMRGFNWFSIARRKFSQRVFDRLVAEGVLPEQASQRALRPFGGTQQAYYSGEFEFGLVQEAGIRGVVFYDIGNADDTLALSEYRQNVGFGFRWFSPIGPLRFEWGFPLDRRPEFEEPAVVFQFAIGSPF